MYNIGIDIGGSHVGIGLVNKNGEIIIKKEKDFTPEDKLEIEKVIIESILKYVDSILLEKNITIKEIGFVGIAFPGTISKDDIILKAENVNLYNFDIKGKLKEHLNVDIKIKNDATLAAIAEKKVGSLKNYEDIVFLTIGTGIGGASFIGGKLLEVKRFSGFEYGHMTIEKDGRDCTCGNKGCWEKYASIKIFKETFRKRINEGNYISGKDIVEVCKQNKSNKEIDKLITEYVHDLTIGISNLINIFEPEVVCIGGSFVHYEDIFVEKIETLLKESNMLFNKYDIPKILLTKLSNDARNYWSNFNIKIKKKVITFFFC